MEPMALGSPVGSPVSPGPSSPMSPYLPSFLMGEPISSGPRTQQPSAMGSRSPSRLGRQVSISAPAQPPPQERPLIHTPGAEKTGGPPTRGLFDNFETYTPQSPLTHQPPLQAADAASPYYAPSPADLSLPLHPSSSRPPAHWVTVFGFPPSSASQVLLQFSRCGAVLETRPAPRGGNWAHVRYGSAAEAARAAGKNAKVLAAGVMVGVVPCTDEDVIGCERGRGKENVSMSGLSDASFMSPCAYPNTPTMPGSAPRSVNSTPLGAPTASPYRGTPPLAPPPRPRQLGQAYANARHASEVQMARHTPQRSAGLVNKAWELLGW